MASDDLDFFQVAVVAEEDNNNHLTPGHTGARSSPSPDAPRLPSSPLCHSTSSTIGVDGVTDKKHSTPTPPPSFTSPDPSRLPSTPKAPSSPPRDASRLQKFARNPVDASDFPITPTIDWPSSQPLSPPTPSARHSNLRVPSQKHRRHESSVKFVTSVGRSQQLPTPPPSVRSSKSRAFWKHPRHNDTTGTVANVHSSQLPSSRTPSARSTIREQVSKRRLITKVTAESVERVGNSPTERKAEVSSRLITVGPAQSDACILLSHTQVGAIGSDVPARPSSPASAITKSLHPSSSSSGETNTGSDAVRDGKRKRDDTDVGHKEARESGSHVPARQSSPASAITKSLHPSSSPSVETNTGSDAVRSGKRKRGDTNVGRKEARESSPARSVWQAGRHMLGF
jgi:hypothetical protein